MTTDQIFAVLLTLLSGQPDTSAFDHLIAGGADARYPVAIEACPRPIPAIDIELQTIICGTVNVPENHGKPEGNRIDLRFAVMKARSQSPAPDPVIYLHGGPGGNAVPGARFYDTLFGAFRDRRDVILFDQRSSGISAQTTTCFDTLADNIFILSGEVEDPDAPDPTKICLEEIAAKGVVLADYNTTQNAYDVRAIMSALGYPTYNIYGISYGTLLGQEVLRSAPEGVRAAVLDSITFAHIPAYDTNGVPLDKAIGGLIEQCAAEADCNAAFPNLEQTLFAAVERLKQEPIPATATRPEITVDTLVDVFADRNHNTIPGIDNYLPLILTEWAEGESSTYDLLVSGALSPPGTADELVQEYADEVDGNQLAIAFSAALQAEQLNTLNRSIRVLLSRLSEDAANPTATGRIESLLDRAIDEAMEDLDRDAIIAMGRSYARFAGTKPDRDAICAWLATYFTGDALEKLQSIVSLMDEGDVAAFQVRAAADTGKIYEAFRENYDLEIYACQESIPFNSPEGYDSVAANYRFPFIGPSQAEVKELYEACEAFTPVPRPEFHEPVTTTIPVLAVSGMNDTQTDNDSATMLARTMTNAQTAIFPEAGHGAIIFSQCAKDVTAAFIDNPTAAIDARCTEKLKPQFVLPQ